MAVSAKKCYAILGLAGDESADQIKRAYRQLARKLHPDRKGGDEEQFKVVTAAYHQLLEVVAQRAALRAAAANSPRRPRRRKDVRPAGTHPQGESPWQPGSRQSEPHSAERADWSSFEKLYRERRKKRAAQRKPHAQSNADTENQGQRSDNTSDDRQNERGETAKTKRTSAKSTSETVRNTDKAHTRSVRRPQPSNTPDEDFAAAWEAWCENAKRFDAKHGWRKVPESEPGTTEDNPTSMTGSESGWRRWLKQKLSDFGKTAPREGQRVRPGADVNLRLQVSVSELLDGSSKVIAVKRLVACPSCTDGETSCNVCHGEGRIEVRDQLKVEIPPSARYGSRLRLKGKGSAGVGGGGVGDLYLELEPAELPGFRREGLNLHGTCLITADMARKGGHVTITLARGTVRIRVPARTCVGDRFRLQGQGLPAGQAGRFGDAFLTVKVEG